MINLYIAIAALIVLPSLFMLGYYGGVKTEIAALENAQDSEDVDVHPILKTDEYKVKIDDEDEDDSDE